LAKFTHKTNPARSDKIGRLNDFWISRLVFSSEKLAQQCLWNPESIIQYKRTKAGNPAFALIKIT